MPIGRNRLESAFLQESLCWGHCCRVADVVNTQVNPFVACIQAWIPCKTEGFIFMRANKARVLHFVSLRVVAQVLVPAQCLLRPTRRLAAAAAFSCEWLHCCVYICHSAKLNPLTIPNEMSILKLEAREYHLNGLSSPPLFVRVVLRIRVATAKQW